MKYFIIAGEASGDLHGSNLMRGLKQKDSDAQFRFWGGDLMLAQGGELRKHYKDLAFMGFVEVAMNLRTIFRNLDFCKKDIIDYKPDAIILIDYPGFNLRIAKFAKEQGIKVFYYISPQVWAWHKSRIKQIRKDIDKLFVILPFEKDFYAKHHVEVDFVGHPLLDAIANYQQSSQTDDFRQRNQLSEKPIIALLPGSRKQEITNMLPVLGSLAKNYPDFEFVIAGVKNFSPDFYQAIYPDASLKIIFNQTYDLLRHAHSAVVTSGTATLETALFNVPEFVCYKGNIVSYWIARMFIKTIKYISLVNLIMDAPVIPELIQHEMNRKNVKFHFDRLINDDAYREQIFANFALLKEKLGGQGASEKVADLILKYIQP